MKRIAVLLTLFCFVAPLTAEQPTGTEEFDPEALAKTIAPFIDELTVAVGRVDLTRLDVDAMYEVLAELATQADGYDPREVVASKPLVDRWVANFRKAGGRDVLFIVSLADLPEPILMVVPVRQGADEQAIRTLLRSGMADASTPRPADQTRPGRRGRHRQVAVVNQAVIACKEPIIQRVRNMTPHARPELATALAAAGDSAAQILILPSADTRRVIEELIPVLPKEVGGGPSTAITRGVTWGAIGITGPPRMSLHAIAQATDAPSARGLSDVLLSVLRWVEQNKPQPLTATPNLAELLAMFRPTVAGDRSTLTLSDAQIRRVLIELAAPALRRARAGARRQISARNMHNIALACQKYRHEEGQWPNELPALVKQGYVATAQVLVNPNRPNDKNGYGYVRPARDNTDYKRLVIYEKHDRWGEGINVGFLDGSVQWMADQARFRKLLKDARDAAEKP